MLHFAKGLDVAGKTAKDFPQLSIYTDNYGFTNRDLGLYALVEHEIAGAAWIRMLSEGTSSNAFIDENTPVLNLGIKPEFRAKGIATAMLEQLILEAGALFDNISVAVNSDTAKFYEHFGFKKVENSDKKSLINSSDIFVMKKELEQKAVVRPTDGYDPRRWMD